MSLHWKLARALAGGALCAACAAPAPVPPPAPVEVPAEVPAPMPDPCLAGDGYRDTLVMALDQPVTRDAAPVPANLAERFAFRQRYETLVRLDCTGALRPGLAERWSGDSSGTIWTFELGEHQFDGGAPVTAERIIESWNRDGLATRRPAIASVRAPGPRTLIVTLGRPAPEGPAILADAGLAVAGPQGSDGWREGTRSATPALELIQGADLRDLLRGADVAVTRDPDAIAYAQGLAEFRVIPLPWDLRYWLVSAPPFPAAVGSDSATRLSFASEVVSGSARPAELGPRIHACLTLIERPRAHRRRVVHVEGDRAGRELAERMVALAGAEFTLVAMSVAGIGRSLLNDPEAAYVLPFPILPETSCPQGIALPDYFKFEPLVDTRPHLILRKDAARVTLDADGAARLLPPGAP
jgi:hypothetical protein